MSQSASEKLIAALTKSGSATVNEDGKLVCTLCGHSLRKAIDEAVLVGEGDNAQELISHLGHRCDYTRGQTRIPILAAVPEGYIASHEFYDAVTGQTPIARNETPRRVLHRLLGSDRYYATDRVPALQGVEVVKVGKKNYFPMAAVALCQEACANDAKPKKVAAPVEPGSPVAVKKSARKAKIVEPVVTNA